MPAAEKYLYATAVVDMSQLWADDNEWVPKVRGDSPAVQQLLLDLQKEDEEAARSTTRIKAPLDTVARDQAERTADSLDAPLVRMGQDLPKDDIAEALEPPGFDTSLSGPAENIKPAADETSLLEPSKGLQIQWPVA